MSESAESVIQALPKVELFLQLEGAWSWPRLLVIAGQNGYLEEAEALASSQQEAGLPEISGRFEWMAETSRWLEYEDDVALMVYEAGLGLARQNVQYAEIHVNTLHFTEGRWSVAQLLQALNDGRRRAEVAWKIRLRWVLSVFRNQPRHADEAVRIASSKEGQNAGIVGICLDGPEGAQPPGQFERAFRTAARKGIPTAVHSNGEPGAADELDEALKLLQPQRLIGGHGILEDPQQVNSLVESETALLAGISEARSLGLVDACEDYPLQQLIDSGLMTSLTCGMPSILGTTLTGEQIAAHRHCGIGLDAIRQMSMNALRDSWLPAEEKPELEAAMQEQMRKVLEDHPELDG